MCLYTPGLLALDPVGKSVSLLVPQQPLPQEISACLSDRRHLALEAACLCDQDAVLLVVTFVLPLARLAVLSVCRQVMVPSVEVDPVEVYRYVAAQAAKARAVTYVSDHLMVVLVVMCL